MAPRRSKSKISELTLCDPSSLRRSPRLIVNLSSPLRICKSTRNFGGNLANSMSKSICEPALCNPSSNGSSPRIVVNLSSHLKVCQSTRKSRDNIADSMVKMKASRNNADKLLSMVICEPELSNSTTSRSLTSSGAALSTRTSPRLRRDVNYSENVDLRRDSKKRPVNKHKKLLPPPPPPVKKTKNGVAARDVTFFVGDPVPEEEARMRWPWRFQSKDRQRSQQRRFEIDDDDDKLVLDVKYHYIQAKIQKCVFNLGDCAYIKGVEGGQDYVGRILEFFKTMDDEDYFRVQWFFRPTDTVMQEEAASHDRKRLFISSLMNDNLLDCIVSKLKIIQITPNANLKVRRITSCDFYYDMEYSVDYSTFSTMISDSCILSSSACMKIDDMDDSKPNIEGLLTHKPDTSELALLDIYSGCGGMSTGLCLGVKLSGLNMATRWALDMNKSACATLKLNHPETQIRNESASDFLDLLKEWDRLCKRYGVNSTEKTRRSNSGPFGQDENNSSFSDEKIPSGEYEVESLVDVCFGDPVNSGKRGLKFQVRWVGYDPSDDTWESMEELSKCQDKIHDFVRKGIKAKILPRPGDADVICGGPPCQGISGYNRFRNVDAPLDDERNRQISIFMDIVNFLKPKYILMENVVDILKFAKGTLGRHALSRLVQMNYQARLGIMAAGCYGLAQFRLRIFLWGAHPYEKLPQFPLPTHNVVLKYGTPSEFERNVVAYEEGQIRDLEKALVLSDAISDLPQVTNHETREEMSYEAPPETEFQKFARASKYEMMGLEPFSAETTEQISLYDHRPLPLNEDDYVRVCLIPRRKGANFRDLPGVTVGSDNVVRRDLTAEPILLPSGKILVPDYAINFGDGKSSRPFGRLWWDEVVPTVICRPDSHNQAVLHPEQDRILTLRETARLQGFPDYFQFRGNIKERYRQIGNAVAIPVARALGYSLGMAFLKSSSDEALLKLPPKFSHSTTIQILNYSSDKADEMNQ